MGFIVLIAALEREFDEKNNRNFIIFDNNMF